MTYQTLEQLAAAYWQGTCSEAEEAELLRTLRQLETDDLSPDLLALRQYAQHLDKERETGSLDESFDAQILSQLTWQAPPARGPRLANRWIKAAATVALLLTVSLGWYFRPVPEPVAQAAIVDTYQDPAVAYQEVRKALLKMSANMNEGMQHTEVIRTFHQTRQAVRNK